MGKKWKLADFIFLVSKVTVNGDSSHKIKKTLASWKEIYDKPRCIKKHSHHLPKKGLYSQSYGFSSSHVKMWELDHKEGWAPKNWCFQIVLEIKPVNPKGNQPSVFIGRADAEAPILFGHQMRRAHSL